MLFTFLTVLLALFPLATSTRTKLTLDLEPVIGLKLQEFWIRIPMEKAQNMEFFAELVDSPDGRTGNQGTEPRPQNNLIALQDRTIYGSKSSSLLLSNRWYELPEEVIQSSYNTYMIQPRTKSPFTRNIRNRFIVIRHSHQHHKIRLSLITHGARRTLSLLRVANAGTAEAHQCYRLF